MDILSYVLGVQAGKKSGGGSGGGGSLTPGVYLSAAPFPNPTNKRFQVFKLNDELYATGCHYTTQGKTSYIYKLDPATNTWSTIMSATDGTAVGNAAWDSTGWYGAEHNGKMYIVSGKGFFAFDGTTITNFNNGSNTQTRIVEFNGKLYVNGDYGEFRIWDEENDVWNEITEFRSYYLGIVFNGALYCYKNKDIYKYNGETMQKVMSVPYSPKQFFVINNNLCYFSGSSFYKINLETGTEILIGKIPSFQSKWFSINTDDIYFVGLTYSTTADSIPFFVVNIVE